MSEEQKHMWCDTVSLFILQKLSQSVEAVCEKLSTLHDSSL